MDKYGSLPKMQTDYVLPFPIQSTRNVAPTWGVGNRGNNPSLKVFFLRQKNAVMENINCM